MTDYEIQEIAAFSDADQGGNPAGVVIAKSMPPEAEMQAIAAKLGHSETVFAAPLQDGWRVRYFAPKTEVAFCGHATIALGAALTRAYGPRRYDLTLNEAQISVEGAEDGATVRATLTSPPTRSEPAPADLVEAALHLFALSTADLNPTIPPSIANAGNDHLVLLLADRARLADLEYDLQAGATLMEAHGVATISLLWAETPTRIHSRNAFAIGGVLEDPATGAAAAALAGLLRDLNWPHEGRIEILQGFDMGFPSRLTAEITDQPGAPIRVSGTARYL
jgi:PhzF family phenazine biosynthesis protein